MKIKVLVVEDNQEVRELLKMLLSTRGFEVVDTGLGEQAIDYCEDYTPDVVVLDLTLPDIDGIEVCKRIKAFPRMQSVPVLICSARAHVSERVKVLELGADDFLTKPFDPTELVARVKALLRRSGQSAPETRAPIQSGALKLDPKNKQATLSGTRSSDITPTEFDILYYLVDRSPEIVSRSEIAGTVLGKQLDEESRAVDMHIAQIRKKIGADLAERLLTVPNKGYQWVK